MSSIRSEFSGGSRDQGRGLKLAVFVVAAFGVLVNLSHPLTRDQFGGELSAFVRPPSPKAQHKRVFGEISESLRIVAADKMAPVIFVADFLDLGSVEVARAVGHALYPRSIYPYDYRFVPSPVEISEVTARVRADSSAPYVFVFGAGILNSPEVHHLLQSLKRIESFDQGLLLQVAKPR